MSAPSPRVLILGGGAAGLFAAMGAGEAGAKPIVLEKTTRLGTKLLISGGGKCNVAHNGPLEGVIQAFTPPEARFIRPSCYRMTNRRIMDLFETAGLTLTTRADGRVFPESGSARDVLEILVECALRAGAEFYLNRPIHDLLSAEEGIVGVTLGEATAHRVARVGPGSEFGAKALLRRVLEQGAATEAGRVRSWQGENPIRCRHVVLAVGGNSYPNSGTTGDGWTWAKKLGHTVQKPRAALAPIYLREPCADLAGVALPSCGLMARAVGGKRITREEGDLLFTHQGVSGPVTLKISRLVALALESGAVELEVDLFPALPAEELTRLILAQPHRPLKKWVEEVAPQRLSAWIAAPVGEKTAVQLGPKAVARAAQTWKAWRIGEVKVVPLEKGEVVSGGVSLEEVDPQTMRSRVVKGLYLAGEILDVAGPVGGYNLQAAFATGYQAGKSAALDALADADENLARLNHR